MKEGQVRVIKLDSLNYQVQRVAKSKNKDTGEEVLKWVGEGYYGANQLHGAFKKAVMLGLPEKEAITLEMLTKVLKEVTG